MKRMLFLLPLSAPPEALEIFRQQLPVDLLGQGFSVDFRGTARSPYLLDSKYESAIAEVMVLEAGRRAEAEGYDLVGSFSVSDTGVDSLRSLLNIPVIGAGQSAFHAAAMLGRRFSIITMWEPWAKHVKENIYKMGLGDCLASVRHINTRPDTKELLAGKEDIVFPLLEAQARRAIDEDGADVIIIGSTTMFASHAFLASRLDCPVINPGPATFKMAEALLSMSLTHSKLGYASPERTSDHILDLVGITA